MSSKILFVFEGEKTEKQIAENLQKYFITENSVIYCAYCTHIYRLYQAISEDEDLDTFSLLKENPKNKEILSKYKSSNFAEIYLFFDYDGHSKKAGDEKITTVLDFFDNETEKGKLYISYPMVEAIKHYSSKIDFKNLKIVSQKKYKQIVGNCCEKKYMDFRKYTKNNWVLLIDFHLKKMNYIISNNYSFPIQNSTQGEIFDQQLAKYINMDNTVAVLSAFPVFLFDYYGLENLIKLLNPTPPLSPSNSTAN